MAGKMTYAQLLADRNKWKAEVDRLRFALKEAGRFPFNWQCTTWLSIPLHQKQHDAVVEYIRDHDLQQFCDYTRKGDEKHFEEVIEGRCGRILPEFPYILIRYATDLQGEEISGIQAWGLTPVDLLSKFPEEQPTAPPALPTESEKPC